MAAVRIRFDNGLEIQISLRDRTPSVDNLLAALPFRSIAHRWGEEVYFDAPFHSDLEQDAKAAMEVGEVAFWPDGDAVAIFFGRTPVSTDSRPRAYSPCNILGRVTGSPAALRTVDEGTGVEVSRA